jgi:hypothetical protein
LVPSWCRSRFPENWNISQSLAGDWVQMVQIEQRAQV